jgi:hypothetical protein
MKKFVASHFELIASLDLGLFLGFLHWIPDFAE